MSKEVACGPVFFIINIINEKGIPFETWHRDIPYDLEHLQNIHERVEWSVLCQLFKNIKPFFSDDEFKQMGQDMPKVRFNRASRVVIKLLYAKVGLLRLMRDHISKAINQNFSCFDVTIDGIGQNGVRQTAILQDGYEFCREFCIVVHGNLIELVILLGHKNFTTNLKWIERGTIIELICPERKPIFARLKDLVMVPLNARSAAIELEDAHQKLLQRYQEIENARLELQKQATQLKTAYEISQVIHKGLDLEATLQAIAHALVEIAGFTAAEIKVTTGTESNKFEIEKSFGTVPNNTKPLFEPLIISGNKIGEIKVWISENTNRNDYEELLNRVSPMVNMTIDDALTHSAVIDHQNNLEIKVKERTVELQEARDDLNETVDLLKKAQSARDRFFANISHEFRTPLTLILGPAKELLTRIKDERARDELKIIHRSANRLNGLVNQLLDLSKLEAGKMTLETRLENIIPLLKGLVLSFTSFAERKRITLKFNSGEKDIIAYIDRDKVEKIINNILSNAFKFTAEGGEVVVAVSKPTPKSPPGRGIKGVGHKSKFIEISIRDTGVGIPTERIDKVFDRFYQVDGSHTREQEGTGLGLALTKELVELHYGEIFVESEAGKGTTFSVRIPLGKKHLKLDEICEEKVIEERGPATVESDLLPDDKKVEEKLDIDILTETEKPLLLIVEDNMDVRNYIRGFLNKEYRILEAIDGEAGLSKSIEQIPDLIVSDVMMPKMDGFELCNKLKTDERTSHIPIIMLTAKATSKDKIEGYETGADDYIMKPFDAKELQVRIKNLIDQRKKLREHFKKEGLIDLENKNITPVDKIFLKRTVEVINKNLSDSAFGVESFASEIALSRVTLHKKLVALIGEPPGELIKRIRLSKAAKLIEIKTGNISEIALDVGFNNPAYFSECFKKQFGVTPTQYQHNFTNH